MDRSKNNSYTNLFKIKVVEKALECGSNRKAAALYGIHEKNIWRWKLILPAIKDEDACKLWVKDIWTKRPGGYFKPRSLLVWDKFSAHLTEGVRKTLDDTKTDIAVIPGGLTSILQPLDVSLNKPFKDELRKRWTAWMAAESYTLTAGGNMRAPPLDTQAN